jgi:hypothetical protein
MEREGSALLSAAGEEQWTRNGFFEVIDSLIVFNKNNGRSLNDLNDTCGWDSLPLNAINSPQYSLADAQYPPQSCIDLGRSLPPSPKNFQSCFRVEDAKVMRGYPFFKTLETPMTIPVDSSR